MTCATTNLSVYLDAVIKLEVHVSHLLNACKYATIILSAIQAAALLVIVLIIQHVRVGSK
jgi:hypothetical protein